MANAPLATYRLQLRSSFSFADVADVADYLVELGVSHVYSSPILQAVPGSAHGYDVVDPTRVNTELGGEDGFSWLCGELRRRGLGLILDIVPNHVAIGGPENPWWWDVLENGPASRYATYFDVDWAAIETEAANKILLPVLGDHYGRILEAGELQLSRTGGAFEIRHHEHRFPLAPRSLDTFLGAAAERCGSPLLAFIADSYGRLPSPQARDPRALARRHRDKEVLQTELGELCLREPSVTAAIDAVIGEWNASPDALDGLLARQNYRLACWHMAEQELGYRRFFDINSLIGLRVEDESVFDDTHRLILRLLREKQVHGLRIDHPDGLRDPETYVQRLRSAAPDAWIVVEKILESEETLPSTWPVEGTTGYDFLNQAAGLFVDPTGELRLTQCYVHFTGEPADYAALVWEKKHQVLRDVLGSDVHRLTALLREVCAQHRCHRDYTRGQLEVALRELVACFPVYRTYVRADPRQVSGRDIEYVTRAVDAAKGHCADLDPALFHFLRDLLLLNVEGEAETEFALRFQQLTGPVMAKGVEDTVFYCFNRLVGLNEVGGDAGRLGSTVADFHAACTVAQGQWPSRMLATSTHDTKRGEDVRARLSLLSELPEQWSEAVWRWASMNDRHRVDGMPDPNAEYLLYQTLVGAWPIETPRVAVYMEKAAREAKKHTSWNTPNEPYEKALQRFVAQVLDDRAFLVDLGAFVDRLKRPGYINSLAQTLLKLTAPGVPDFYQGTELWDFGLVDPDNRRPVDYDLRRRLLAEAKSATPECVLERIEGALPKTWLIHRVLTTRRRRPGLFAPSAEYHALDARGTRAAHVVAFMRGEGAITVVPRLVIRLDGDWLDTVIDLPLGRWRNELTGEVMEGGAVPLRKMLARFPMALLLVEI